VLLYDYFKKNVFVTTYGVVKQVYRSWRFGGEKCWNTLALCV